MVEIDEITNDDKSRTIFGRRDGCGVVCEKDYEFKKVWIGKKKHVSGQTIYV